MKCNCHNVINLVLISQHYPSICPCACMSGPAFLTTPPPARPPAVDLPVERGVWPPGGVGGVGLRRLLPSRRPVHRRQGDAAPTGPRGPPPSPVQYNPPYNPLRTEQVAELLGPISVPGDPKVPKQVCLQSMGKFPWNPSHPMKPSPGGCRRTIITPSLHLPLTLRPPYSAALRVSSDLSAPSDLIW